MWSAYIARRKTNNQGGIMPVKAEKWIVINDKRKGRLLYSKKANNQGLHFVGQLDEFGRYKRIGSITEKEFKKLKVKAK